MFNQIHQVDSYLIWQKHSLKAVDHSDNNWLRSWRRQVPRCWFTFLMEETVPTKRSVSPGFQKKKKHVIILKSTHIALCTFFLCPAYMHCWLFKWIHTLLLLLSPPSKSWSLGVPLAQMIKLTAPPQGRNWLRGKEEFGEATRKKTLSMTISR